MSKSEPTPEQKYGQPYVLRINAREIYLEVSPEGELRVIDSDFKINKLEKVTREQVTWLTAARNS